MKGFEVVMLTFERSVELFLAPKAKEVPAAVVETPAASSFLVAATAYIFTGVRLSCWFEPVGLEV